MADVSHLGFASDVEAAMHMVERVGVAVVPGSSFYSQPELGRHAVRFSFCKRMETLRQAGERMRTRLGPPS
jgi:aminotransferase